MYIEGNDNEKNDFTYYDIIFNIAYVYRSETNKYN